MHEVQLDLGSIEHLQLDLVFLVWVGALPEVQTRAERLASGFQVVSSGPLILTEETLVYQDVDDPLNERVSICERQLFKGDLHFIVKLRVAYAGV